MYPCLWFQVVCCSIRLLSLFFFKQKTAYEMRISDWSSDVCSSDLRRSSAPEIPIDENHRELHRVGRLAITLREARLTVGPDFPDLRGQFGPELHLLLDDPLPASGQAETLFELRHHRLAIFFGRFVEMSDRFQHPCVDEAQEGFVVITVAHLLFSAAFFLRIAS